MNDHEKKALTDDLLKRRFGGDGRVPETLQEAADRLRVTRQEVRRMECAALRRAANGE